MYIINHLQDGDLFTEEHEAIEYAIVAAESQWDQMTNHDKKHCEEFNLYDDDAGEYVRIWKKDGQYLHRYHVDCPGKESREVQIAVTRPDYELTNWLTEQGYDDYEDDYDGVWILNEDGERTGEVYCEVAAT